MRAFPVRLEDETPNPDGPPNLRMDFRRAITTEDPGPIKRSIFRKLHYPGVGVKEWNDWRWQMSHRIRKLGELERILNLSPDERGGLMSESGPLLPFAITPYYASLLDPDDPSQPLRRTVVPTQQELCTGFGEAADPLGEDEQSPVPGLVHRYPDRVLLLVTGICSTYCRYCTRSRLVGDSNEKIAEPGSFEKRIEYIRAHPEIRDVLVSGGDPLTMPESKLSQILGQLRAIPHVEIIRIGTKVPVVLPQRLTPKLISVLKKYHPLFINIHATHPAELTPEFGKACAKLANAGIPLASQTVLLAGINDDAEVLRSLFTGLLRHRVRPYYLYQCDPVLGTSHFRTPISRGLEMISGLRGYTSGLAVPTFVVDAPGGGGKIPLAPQTILGENDHRVALRNFRKQVFYYPQPPELRRDSGEKSC